ncbi:deaminase [Jeotgalibacillus alimentarius]|uniref:Deaminase n=1 Tax=Jeotgalibacillus alimentarius TaxID=135826 RepID=A0A0C2W690_9BACL|nr:dihydrofolate reductase family protein [Jeotgalibacillus alimentarius]KIL51528.1 deaminase [Jeotgalibacillus alimentarius]
MSKNILYIAMSLDGMIAKSDHSLDWLLKAEGEGDNGYNHFYSGISSVVMGNRTYQEVLKMMDEPPYQDRPVYVLSKTVKEDGYATFTSEPVETLLPELQKKHDGPVWVVGGGEVIKACMASESIDEYYIAVIPVVLGEGIPLFPEGTKYTELKFKGTEIYNQIVMLHYVKKQAE